MFEEVESKLKETMDGECRCRSSALLPLLGRRSTAARMPGVTVCTCSCVCRNVRWREWNKS